MGHRTTITDRYKAILKINQVALTQPTVEAVFQRMCIVLERIVCYDRAGITLYDHHADALRLIATYGPHENSVFRVGHLLGLKDTQTGWAFENQRRVIRRDLRTEFKFPYDRHTADEGFRSLCSVPLVVRANSIGVVSIIGVRPNQFSSHHADVVQEMGNQIALAISSLSPCCSAHINTKLVCPRCIGAAGGKKTVAKHRDALSMWGKKGGRGKKLIFDSLDKD